MADPTTKRHRAPRRELVPLAVFAEHCGVNQGTVRRWVAQGTLPAFRLPSTGRNAGPLRVDLADVELVVRRARPEQVYSRPSKGQP